MSTLQQQAAGPQPAAAIVARLRASFDVGRTRPLAYRQQQLAGLARFLKECEREIEAALFHDMGRPAFEAYPPEVAFIAAEVAHLRKKLPAWA